MSVLRPLPGELRSDALAVSGRRGSGTRRGTGGVLLRIAKPPKDPLGIRIKEDLRVAGVYPGSAADQAGASRYMGWYVTQAGKSTMALQPVHRPSDIVKVSEQGSHVLVLSQKPPDSLLDGPLGASMTARGGTLRPGAGGRRFDRSFGGGTYEGGTYDGGERQITWKGEVLTVKLPNARSPPPADPLFQPNRSAAPDRAAATNRTTGGRESGDAGSLGRSECSEDYEEDEGDGSSESSEEMETDARERLALLEAVQQVKKRSVSVNPSNGPSPTVVITPPTGDPRLGASVDPGTSDASASASAYFRASASASQLPLKQTHLLPHSLNASASNPPRNPLRQEEEIRELVRLKERAVRDEDYKLAKELKIKIEELMTGATTRGLAHAPPPIPPVPPQRRVPHPDNATRLEAVLRLAKAVLNKEPPDKAPPPPPPVRRARSADRLPRRRNSAIWEEPPDPQP
eukprot:Hpha_TRINITY_DN17479_c0_g1::TRINITY_DN17479_c0_g1_i1::g.85778::m.85778